MKNKARPLLKKSAKWLYGIFFKVCLYFEKVHGTKEAEEALKLFDENPAELPIFFGQWKKKYEDMDALCVPVSDNLYKFDFKCLDGIKRALYIISDSEISAKAYYKQVMMEQDRQSPHLYFSEKVINKAKNGTVIDLGCAEGNFELSLAGQIRKAYVFEADTSWNYALKNTFSKCSFDYTIINKYVSDKSDEEKKTISVDDFFGEEIPTDISIIKMDIEGYEQKALYGMKRTLEMNPEAILLVCTYHNRNAEKEIRSILKDYDITARTEKMLYQYNIGEGIYKRNIIPPFFRTGVVEVEK